MIILLANNTARMVSLKNPIVPYYQKSSEITFKNYQIYDAVIYNNTYLLTAVGTKGIDVYSFKDDAFIIYEYTVNSSMINGFNPQELNITKLTTRGRFVFALNNENELLELDFSNIKSPKLLLHEELPLRIVDMVVNENVLMFTGV